MCAMGGIDWMRLIINMKKLFLTLTFALVCAFPPGALHAQISGYQIRSVSVGPSGACTNAASFQFNNTNGNFWGCVSGVWTQLNTGGGGGGSGTVSSGTITQVPYYAATGTTVSPNTHLTVTSAGLWTQTAASNTNGTIVPFTLNGTCPIGYAGAGCPQGVIANPQDLTCTDATDHCNEVHFRFQAGATTDHRAYLEFDDHTGTQFWQMGRNAQSVWITYDVANNIHRIWFDSGSANFNSYLNAASNGQVILNGQTGGGTGGFTVQSGGTTPVTWFRNAQSNTTIANEADAANNFFLQSGLTTSQNMFLNFQTKIASVITTKWLVGNHNTDNAFEIFNSNLSSYAMYILSTTSSIGVGPGDTAPTGTLHVSDKTATTGATRLIIARGAADTSATVTLSSDGSASFSGSVSAGSVNTSGTIVSGASLVAAAASSISFNGRTRFMSSADGRLSATASNTTSPLTQLTFGVETSASPALLLSGTNIGIGLGDGTSAGSFSAPALYGSGAIPARTNNTGTVTMVAGSTNLAGTLTSGTTGAVNFTLTWGGSFSYPNRAVCVFRDETTAAASIGVVQSTPPTGSTITVAGTGLINADVISYFCHGY